MVQQITPDLKNTFNERATHPLQAFEWGEFRKKTGIKVIRRGFDPSSEASGLGKMVDGFQVTIHPIPHTPFFAGYLPKGNMPTKEIIDELQRIGKEEHCIFIQLEPNVILSETKDLDSSAKPQNNNEGNQNLGLRPAHHPLFTKYTMVLDLTKSEEELLKNMHPKTRYNIKVAQKHGVSVQEDDSDKTFNKYIELTNETTSRQGFFAHNEKYHRLMWETLRSQIANRKSQMEDSVIARIHQLAESKQSHKIEDVVGDRHVAGAPRDDKNNKLSARLLTASYQGKILVTWIVFVFHDTLYYPYGASSSENREVMASTAMMWETIRWGKKMGLTKFDMWGSLGPEPDPKDPWYGFHRFKQGFGPELVEFVGSYDLVINPALYQIYKIADKLRWMLLKFRR